MKTRLTALKPTVMHMCCFRSYAERWITSIRGVFLYKEWVKPHPPSCTQLCVQALPISKRVLGVFLYVGVCVCVIFFSTCFVLKLRPTKPLTSKTQKTSGCQQMNCCEIAAQRPTTAVSGATSSMWLLHALTHMLHLTTSLYHAMV